MNLSIRKFLLVNLLLTIILTTACAVIGNYFLDRRDIHNHLDILLNQSTYNFDALLGPKFYQRNLDYLQNKLNHLPTTSILTLNDNTEEQILVANEKYQFQVWSKNGKLLLHSAQAPLKPLSNLIPGYGIFTLDQTEWRTYTVYDSMLNLYVIGAEKILMRKDLAQRIIFDDIYILLLIYPIAGLLIWLIIGIGLKSICRVANEVSHRDPNFLEPVAIYSIPPEIKPLVIELNKLFLRLQQAIEREKRFAADAAHELRTPLAALKTQAQVALRASNDNERKQQLINVIAGTDRCTHIVQQLLTLSRLVPGANVLSDTITVDLGKLAAEIVAQLAPMAIEKNIEIELIVEKNNIFIIGNITALSILLRNLIDNAIRYTLEGGEISVSICTQEQNVILKVSDNGPGIPAELRARVFERFFRVLGNKSPGSGLGLAIVQQIAQLHDAQLRLGPSVSGKGLEVEVIFKI